VELVDVGQPPVGPTPRERRPAPGLPDPSRRPRLLRMATEAYTEVEATFGGTPIPDVFAVTLHNPDSDDPHGALTTHQPLPEGARGPLIVTGRRDGKRWQVILPEIEVYRSTAVGCEFTIFGPARRRELPTSAP